jgi:pilus assembly protein CpaB
LAEPLAVGDSESSAPVEVRRPASGADRRRHPRTVIDETGAAAVNDRRQGGDRRSMSDLRNGLSWTAARDSGGRRRGGPRFKMKASRIAVLAIAACAGTVAAFLAVNASRPPPAPAVAEVEQAPTTRVLVASQSIGVGQKITTAAVAWQPWPQDAVASDYITADNDPAAMDDMAGAVVRSQFLPGDPIRREKLAEGADRYLPAMLDGGLRAVSVMILAESASGGFVAPNDRVDVVMTRNIAGADGSTQIPRSQTIVRNVRVLAIDDRLGAERSDSEDVKSDVFSGQALATLAASRADAEVIISAASVGKLSLLLRGSTDATVAAGTAADDSANQAIRITSPFWTQ